MTLPQFPQIFTTVPNCTNPRCPITIPHPVAELGFGASTYCSKLHGAFLRLAQNQPLSGDLESFSLVELCHGGSFGFKIDANGPVSRTSLCPYNCHATKQAELLAQAQQAGLATWDCHTLLAFRCNHGLHPMEHTIRGRFVRIREDCPFSDLAIGQGMIADRDVFDDDSMLFSNGQAIE